MCGELRSRVCVSFIFNRSANFALEPIIELTTHHTQSHLSLTCRFGGLVAIIGMGSQSYYITLS